VIVGPARGAVRAALAEQLRAAGEREPAWPNTAKLDLVWLFREASHAGSWLSLGPGLVRIVTPLFSTRVVELAMSMRPEWRAGNRVVRHLFARLARPLADTEVEGRGPGGPLHVRNAHRFAAASLGRGQRALDKVAQVVAGRRVWAPSINPGFDRRVFRASVLDALEREGALPVDRLASGSLYHRRPLEALLRAARREPFDQTDLLGRIVSIELTMRASESSVE
jgi:hypothetical protein